MSSILLESITSHPWPVAVAVIALVVAVIVNYFTKSGKLPPGPTGLPFLGYFPFFKAERVHIQFEELGKKYGDIYSFTSTGTLWIHVGSHKVAREIYVSKSDCFETKPVFAENLFEEGLIMDSGESWKILRKFYNQYLKDCGFSAIKDEKAGPFYDSTLAIISELTNSKGSTINITQYIRDKSIYIISKILFGEYGMTESEFLEFTTTYDHMVFGLTDVKYLLCTERLRSFFFPRDHIFKHAMKCQDKMEALMQKVLRRNESTLDENHIRDVFDAYLVEKLARKRKNDATAEYFGDKGFISTLMQVAGDGVTTVSLFTCNFIKALLDYPEEQEKLYQEIIGVVGSNRQPVLEDKSKLPYTNSFMYEVMRITEFFPLIPSLQCTRETTISGFKIPKGAATMFDFWAINTNPNTYEDPYQFKASRFITSPGKTKPDLPVIFGIGKRSCIGEYYTMMQAFLFLTTIVKNFKLRYPEDAKREDPVNFAEGNVYAIAEPRQD